MFQFLFGGTFFTLVDASQLDVKLIKQDIPFLISFTKKLLGVINETYDICHPQLDIKRAVNAEYYLSDNDGFQRSIVVSEDGVVDRSPCGTGTSAKLAYLFANEKISLYETYVNDSFAKARFTGVCCESTKVGKFDAVVTEISGNVYICGESTYLIDEDDSLAYGFLI